MPTVYLTPGVYINEVSSGNRPIEGVATSVAAFVGLAPGGPVNTPKKVLITEPRPPIKLVPPMTVAAMARAI